MIDYEAIKHMGEELGRPVATLIALAASNDPFYLGDARVRDAEWFAAIYHEHGFGKGVHLRRIHYRLLSTSEAILLPDGTPYENSKVCWDNLLAASLAARYAGLVPTGDFVDRRNPDPVLCLEDTPNPEPVVSDSGFGAFPELRLERPYLPELGVSQHRLPDLTPPTFEELDAGAAVQPYHVELWCEKTTASDILNPLALQYRTNVTYGAGELSATSCSNLVGRINANGGRRVRILYISDFDPGGQSMPVAVARKIEFLVRSACSDADIQVRPIVLTYDQCVEYGLPRTPIKETELRGVRFEERFGEGATELDALEALHPGELRRIVEDEILRYQADPDDLDGRWQEIVEDTNDELEDAAELVHEEHADVIDPIVAEHREITERAEALRDQAERTLHRYQAPYRVHAEALLAVIGRAEAAIAPIVAQYQAEVVEPAEALRVRAGAAFADVAEDLRVRGEAIVRDMQRIVEHDADEDQDPLYDSSRGYVEQIDRYKKFQDKPVAGKKPGRPRNGGAP